MLKQIIFGLAISIVSTSVYYGNGKIHFSHMDQDAKHGARIVYRPERYQRYSPLGKAWICYFAAKAYYSKALLIDKYYEDIVATAGTWLLIEWDYEGNYYYNEAIENDLMNGQFIGYGFVIIDDDKNIIYNDTYHYSSIQRDIPYCELDEKADYNDKKCSEILDGNEYHEYSGDGNKHNEYSSDENSSTTSKGKVVAAVIIPVILIALVVGVVIYIRKKRADSERANSRNVQNTTPANTAIPLNQLQPHNATTQPGQVNTAYQPATQPPTIYQPPLPAASRPPPARQTPYQKQVIQPAVGHHAAVQ